MKTYPEVVEFFKQNKKHDNLSEQKELLKFRYQHFYNYNFYSQICLSDIALDKAFGNLASADIVAMGRIAGATTKEINKIQAKYKRYMELNPKMKENVDKLLLQN